MLLEIGFMPARQIVDDAHLVALLQQQVDDMAADEPGPAGDDARCCVITDDFHS